MTKTLLNYEIILIARYMSTKFMTIDFLIIFDKCHLASLLAQMVLYLNVKNL